MKKTIIKIVFAIAVGLLLSIAATIQAQVSDDWGKWNGKDTVRTHITAHEAHQRYASKKARVTHVTMWFPKDNYCADHALGIIGNPFGKVFGLRYDYMPHKANSFNSIGFYVSFAKFQDWGSKVIPQRTLYSQPKIPENTSHTTVTYSNGKYKCGDWQNCCECDPVYIYITEYVYIHDTTWVNTVTTNNIYIPPDERVVQANERYRLSIGPNFHWYYYLDWYISAGICLNGYIEDKAFILPFNNKETKPITYEVGLMAEVWQGVAGIQYETGFHSVMLSIGYRF